LFHQVNNYIWFSTDKAGLMWVLLMLQHLAPDENRRFYPTAFLTVT